MSPEVLCRQNHSYPTDYFAVGVIAHEMMLRRRPFHGRSRKEIRQEVLARQIQIKKHEIPDDWSLEAADFINRLLHRKPTLRLGHLGIDEILKHPWLRNFPIQKVSSRGIQAPWHPDMRKVSWDDEDCSSEQTEIKELVAQNEIMLRNQQVQSNCLLMQSSSMGTSTPAIHPKYTDPAVYIFHYYLYNSKSPGTNL